MAVVYLSEFIVSSNSVLTSPLQISGNKIACPLEVLEESPGEVGDDIGIHGLRLVVLEPIEDGVTVGPVDGLIEEVVLESPAGPCRGGGGHVDKEVLDHGVSKAEGGSSKGVVDAGVNLRVIGGVGGGVQVEALVDFRSYNLPISSKYGNE